MSDFGQLGDAGNFAQPSLAVVRQYIKDLSFECPRPVMPDDRARLAGLLSFDSGVNVTALSDDRYEVRLVIRGAIRENDRNVVLVELIYAGLFRLTGFPHDQIDPTLHIAAPELLFPFARNIVVGLCVWSGLQPNVGRVDFPSAYRQRLSPPALNRRSPGS